MTAPMFQPFKATNTNECADCRADVEMFEQHPGVWSLQIQHDPTCPTLARIRLGRAER